MWEFENKNYVNSEVIDWKVDKISLDEKRLVNDARKVAEKIKSWDRREFQDEIISTVNNLNKKFQWEKALLQNEQESDKIVLELAKDIDNAIKKYIWAMKYIELWTELNSISENADLQTQELVQWIKSVIARNKVKQELKLSASEQLLADYENKRNRFAWKSVWEIFKSLF